MSHFGGGSTYGRKFTTRHCSECGHELYADEELICQECEDIKRDNIEVDEE